MLGLRQVLRHGTLLRSNAAFTATRGIKSMKLRPELPTRPKLSHEETDRLNTGNISDFDIYNDLPTPANTVEVVLHNGFRLTSGVRVITEDPVNKPLALLLLGTEAFEIDLSAPGMVQGLDKGFVTLSKEVLSVLEVVHPKPELLVVGLGKKSRLLTPDTRKLITSLGIQIELSTTVSVFIGTSRPFANMSRKLLPIILIF